MVWIFGLWFSCWKFILVCHVLLWTSSHCFLSHLFSLCAPVSHYLITPCAFRLVLFPHSLLVHLFPHDSPDILPRLFPRSSFVPCLPELLRMVCSLFSCNANSFTWIPLVAFFFVVFVAWSLVTTMIPTHIIVWIMATLLASSFLFLKSFITDP